MKSPESNGAKPKKLVGITKRLPPYSIHTGNYNLFGKKRLLVKRQQLPIRKTKICDYIYVKYNFYICFVVTAIKSSWAIK
jgi:hypothetical protein